MFKVIASYSPPLRLITGETTEFCQLACLWFRAHDDSDEETPHVRLHMHIPSISKSVFDLHIAEVNTSIARSMPHVVAEYLWFWLCENVNKPDSVEVRVQHVLVGDANDDTRTYD